MTSRRRGGLTLAEVVLAVGLLGLISLALISVFSKLLTSSARNADLAAGQALAQKVLDRAVREGPPNWGTMGGGQGSQAIYSHDTANSLSYLYTVTPTLLTAPATDYPMGPVYNVQVSVYWWPEAADSTGSRREMGRLWTQLSQIVHVP